MDSKKNIKQLSGIVVSNKMQNAIVVKVDRRFAHPKYKKIITKSKKYLAVVEGDKPEVGVLVTISSCKPVSKRISHKLVK